ncbi:MAG: glycosyltransferase family 4 protein [Gemmatimonadaceae bacterium]
MSGVVRPAAVPAAHARPLRVCLVGPSLDILGGQAIILDRLRRGLESVPGLEVSFLPVNPRLPGPLAALQRVKYVRTVVTTIAYVASLLRHLRHVDVVHAFSASYWSFLLAPVPAICVGRLFGKAVILNYRSGEADDHLANWTSATRFARLAHAIVVPSDYLVDVFARYGLRARSIFNFVETERIPFRSRGGARLQFLSNRNLEPLYNVGCSIRAFGQVQRDVPDAELSIAGDGAERPRLEALVRELGLRHVRFLGRVPPTEMPALYDAADVYINSPDIDNMPNSIIEAFAAGLPVVTTDAGGIPYIVRHESNALMVASGDADALGRAALRLVQEPALAERLAAVGRTECLERYVWPAVRDAWMRLYRDVARQARGASLPSQPDAA